MCVLYMFEKQTPVTFCCVSSSSYGASITLNQRSHLTPSHSFFQVKHFLPIIFLGNKNNSQDRMPGIFIQ